MLPTFELARLFKSQFSRACRISWQERGEPGVNPMRFTRSNALLVPETMGRFGAFGVSTCFSFRLHRLCAADKEVLNFIVYVEE